MVGDKELDTGFRCWSCKEFTTLRARIAELEQDLAYFPSTVRSLAETVTEREAEINQLRAELAAIKAQDTIGEVVGWYRLDRPYEMTAYPSVCATWHKLGAPVAPLYAAPVSEAKAQGEYGDAYQGAREDLAIWKRRALEAEEKVLQQEQIIDHITSEAQGESRFGEPVITAGEPCVPDGYVLADKKSLGMVLQALVNAPHHIRELQATRQPIELFIDNPINVLIANYEAPAAPVQQPKCRTCDDNGLIGGPSFYSPDEGGEPCPDCSAPVQQVSVPDELDRAFITGESYDGEYRVVIQSETLKEMQAVHRWLAMLSSAPAAPAADAGLVEAFCKVEQALDLIGGIRHGKNVTQDELWQSCELLDAALAAHRAKGVV